MTKKQAQAAYTKELDDVAAWFENSGVDEWAVKDVARIIRKWIPESALKPEYQRKEERKNDS